MSSFYDLASLVVVPSGYKSGKIYAQKPLSTDGELTFSRGSDIEATRVASNGYIQKAAVNLLLQSNTFNTTWTNYQSTETGGQSGYDGTNDAWKLTRLVDGGNGVLYQSGLSFSLATFSVYAKAAEENWIYIEIVGSTFPAQYFDLQNGVKGTGSGIGFIDSSIEPVSGATGWYRISITANVSSGNRVSIYNATADNTLTGSVNNGVYIQDAQLNYGLVAQEYQETTTTTVVSGITNDMPRLDYSGGASCQNLKLEPSRTNLIPQSEYIADWNQTNATTSSNQSTSPEGVNNASLSTATGTGAHAPFDTLAGSVTSGANYTMSIFYKKGTTNYLRFEEGYTGIGIDIDIDAESATPRSGATNANIEDYGNSWYRASFGFTGHGSGASQIVVYIKNSSDQTSYTASGESVYLYGAQIEAGHLTSYIPCYGTSNSRLAESCSKTGISSLIGQTEGTIFVEAIFKSGYDTNNLLLTLSNTSSNMIYLNRSTGQLEARVVASGVVSLTYATPYVLTTGTHKVALAYKANDFAVYLDGTLVHSDTSGSVPACNKLNLGTYFNDGLSFNDGIKQALLFPTRLTNAQLAELTTL